MRKEIKLKSIGELFANNGQIDGIPPNPRFIRDDSYLDLKKSILVFPNMLSIDTIAYAERGVILGGNQRHAVLSDIYLMTHQEIKSFLESEDEFKYKTEANRAEILDFWKAFLKEPKVPAQDISALTLEEKLEFVFKDNRSYGETDWKVIEDDWADSLDMVYKWSGEEPIQDESEESGSGSEPARGKLSDRFIINPFSILDARTGVWQDRKRFWQSLGIKSELGRGGSLSLTALTPTNYDEKKKLEKELDRKLSVKEYKSMATQNLISSTSIFDPTLCELNYKWFCPDGGEIIDPFAGGSVRGIVANYLGFKYTGIDVRPEQVESNQEQGTEILGAGNEPTWITGDSNEEITKLEDGREFDFIFSCPPYGDLEVYSDLEGDISNLKYEEFIVVYKEIIRKAVERLKTDRFASFVVGDFRDKNGFYNNFVSDTIAAFRDAGMELYNEMILVVAGGSIATRAGRFFSMSRKVSKQHQNVLVFYKGDPKKIGENFPELDLSYMTEDETDEEIGEGVKDEVNL